MCSKSLIREDVEVRLWPSWTTLGEFISVRHDIFADEPHAPIAKQVALTRTEVCKADFPVFYLDTRVIVNQTLRVAINGVRAFLHPEHLSRKVWRASDESPVRHAGLVRKLAGTSPARCETQVESLPPGMFRHTGLTSVRYLLRQTSIDLAHRFSINPF